jgi:hypothetical protein
MAQRHVRVAETAQRHVRVAEMAQRHVRVAETVQRQGPFFVFVNVKREKYFRISKKNMSAGAVVPGTDVPVRELEEAQRIFPELERELILDTLASAYMGAMTHEGAWSYLRSNVGRRALQVVTQNIRLGGGSERIPPPSGGETPKEAFFRRMSNELPLRGLRMRGEMEHAWILAEREVGADASEMVLARKAEEIFRRLFMDTERVRFLPDANPAATFPYLQYEPQERAFRGVVAGRWYTREVFGVKSSSSAVLDPGLMREVRGATEPGTFRALPLGGDLTLAPFEDYRKSSIYIDVRDERTGRHSRQVVRGVRERPPPTLENAWLHYRTVLFEDQREPEPVFVYEGDEYDPRDEDAARDVYFYGDRVIMTGKIRAGRHDSEFYYGYEDQPEKTRIHFLLDTRSLKKEAKEGGFRDVLAKVQIPFRADFAHQMLTNEQAEPSVRAYHDAVKYRKHCSMLHAWRERYEINFAGAVTGLRNAETEAPLTVLGWGYLEPLDENAREQREAYVHRFHRLPASYLNMERGYTHAVTAALYIHLDLPKRSLDPFFIGAILPAAARGIIDPRLPLSAQYWFEMLCTTWLEERGGIEYWYSPHDLANTFMVRIERHAATLEETADQDRHAQDVRDLRSAAYTTAADLRETPFGRTRMMRERPELLRALMDLGSCKPAEITGVGGATIIYEDVHSGASDTDPGPDSSESESERTERRRREREARGDEGGEPGGRPRSGSRDVSLARTLGFGAGAPGSPRTGADARARAPRSGADAQARAPRSSRFGAGSPSFAAGAQARPPRTPLSRLDRLRLLNGLSPKQ